MTTPRFYLADGRLSAYGLACGYVANAKIGSVDVELYREHGVYHVRRIDRSATAGPIESWRTWDSFHTVNEAWARWNRHVSALYCESEESTEDTQ